MSLLFSTGALASSLSGAVNAAWELLTPSSVTTTSGTATIESDGSITCSSVEFVTVNDVFSTTYRNYYIMQNSSIGSAGNGPNLLMTASGTADTDTNYKVQRIDADNSSRSGARATSNASFTMTTGSTTTKRLDVHWLGDPAGAYRTTWECQVINAPGTGLRWHRRVGIKDETTTYDGFSFGISGGPLFSGKISVYGVKGG